LEEVCEHLESSPIGNCSICGRTVCTDCYREIFNAMICDQHENLEDEGEWELVGYYAVGTDLEERRYILEDHAITSLVVEGDQDGVELYVTTEDKDDAYASLSAAAGAGSQLCGACKIEVSADIEECPLCGNPPAASHDTGYLDSESTH